MLAREWDARAYHSVSEPQFAWGKTVLSTLELRGDETVMDAGCGTGRLTSLLLERVPAGLVVAIDRSSNMTRVAAETLAPFGTRAPIVVADVSVLPFGSCFDVVFSTATFHWVRDHDRLFAHIRSCLRPGGRLHAQCGGGANLQRVRGRARALMQTAEFASLFRAWEDPWEYADADTTRERLIRAGFTDIHTGIEPSPVNFLSAESFSAFVATVILRPYLNRIADEGLRKSFLDQITSAAAGDDPAFELDYWRLNIRARRA
jgi:trans-aconitate 2-methyltransferase